MQGFIFTRKPGVRYLLSHPSPSQRTPVISVSTCDEIGSSGQLAMMSVRLVFGSRSMDVAVVWWCTCTAYTNDLPTTGSDLTLLVGNNRNMQVCTSIWDRGIQLSRANLNPLAVLVHIAEVISECPARAWKDTGRARVYICVCYQKNVICARRFFSTNGASIKTQDPGVTCSGVYSKCSQTSHLLF